MTALQPLTAGRPPTRWWQRLIQASLILLTLALMAAILLPVFRGVSNDSRPRDAMGLPMGDRPHRPPPPPPRR